ncbi:FCP1 homology domain-containing protein [Trichonephila clavata]|uniref:FCP1 homology domain-containing protein n=1 Tax=Trichonephila clavata TaxID=2740835 RepID=A0A8X6JYN1_TRICU|nr:FCP1 homology domain-containing protein [Trichonephila clavata]
MDETLGFSTGETFHVRPKFQTLINFSKLIQADIILWSLGSDNYVHRVVNGFLPELVQHLFKLFARSECNYSKTYYQYTKASAHIRDLYVEPIFLIAVDDKVSENMDEQYDLRIYVPPYTKVNSCDKELLQVCEKIVMPMKHHGIQ